MKKNPRRLITLQQKEILFAPVWFWQNYLDISKSKYQNITHKKTFPVEHYVIFDLRVFITTTHSIVEMLLVLNISYATVAIFKSQKIAQDYLIIGFLCHATIRAIFIWFRLQKGFDNTGPGVYWQFFFSIIRYIL